MAEQKAKAGWGIRLAAVAVTLLAVVVVFAVKFSSHGNEMKAVITAGLPVAGGIVAAYLSGLVKRFAALRWHVYLYVLLAIAGYLIVVELV